MDIGPEAELQLGPGDQGLVDHWRQFWHVEIVSN